MLEQGFRVQSVTQNAITLVYVPLDMPVTMALVFQDAPPPESMRTGGRGMAAVFGRHAGPQK